jgi:hypothetical protein
MIGRAFEHMDPDALEDACFGWINTLLADTDTDTDPETAKVVGPAVGGKTIRGAKNPDGKAPHLFSAVRHDTATLAGQRQPPAATGSYRPRPTRSTRSPRSRTPTSPSADHATPAEPAALRSLAISPLRLTGWNDITQATRYKATHRTNAPSLTCLTT